MSTVWIPPPMQGLTGGQKQVAAEGKTVGQALRDLEERFAGITQRLCEGDRLRSGIAVSVDGVVCPEGLRAAIQPESEVHFLPAISGGAA